MLPSWGIDRDGHTTLQVLAGQRNKWLGRRSLVRVKLTVIHSPEAVEHDTDANAWETDTGDCGASLTELVEQARCGSSAGWSALFERFEGLVRSIAGRYRLPSADADDLCQTVWLTLLERIDTVKEPRALPGWVSTTAARECLRMVGRTSRSVPIDPSLISDSAYEAWQPVGQSSQRELDEAILRDETRRAVRNGLEALSLQHQQLLMLVVSEPPVPYVEIGKELEMPIGSIGPTRARCLKKLGDTEPVRALLSDSDDGLHLAG